LIDMTTDGSRTHTLRLLLPDFATPSACCHAARRQVSHRPCSPSFSAPCLRADMACPLCGTRVFLTRPRPSLGLRPRWPPRVKAPPHAAGLLLICPACPALSPASNASSWTCGRCPSPRKERVKARRGSAASPSPCSAVGGRPQSPARGAAGPAPGLSRPARARSAPPLLACHEPWCREAPDKNPARPGSAPAALAHHGDDHTRADGSARVPNPPAGRTRRRLLVTQCLTPATNRPLPHARGLGHHLDPAMP
jgi:hypothetical protein